MMYAVSKGVYYVQVCLWKKESMCREPNCLPRPPPPCPAGATFTHSEPDPSWPRASLISLLGKGRTLIWLRLHESRADANAAPRTRRKLLLFSRVFPFRVLRYSLQDGSANVCRHLSVAQPSRSIFSGRSHRNRTPFLPLSRFSLRSWRTTSWPSPTTLPP